MGLGELVAAGCELLHGDELLALPLLHGVYGGGLPQAPDGGEGRDQGVVPLDDEAGGVGFVDADGLEPEATEVELVADLQRHRQVLLHGGGILVVPDLQELALHGIEAGAAVLRVEGLGPDGEEGGVEGQGFMDLEPGDAEGHHHVGHRVGLGEEVADLGQGLDVPVGDVVLPHGLLPALLEAPLLHLALPHRLHDLEAHLGVQAHLDEIQHDVVTAAHRLRDGGGAAEDQVPGVAQPHVGAVGETGEPHQGVEVLGLGINQHLTGELGVELRDGHGPGGAQDLIVLKAQGLAAGKEAQGVRVV